MKKELLRVNQNAGILIVVQVVSKIMGVLFAVVLARRLGAENFGILAFALSVSSLLWILSSFGFPNLISRDLSRQPQHLPEYFWTILFLKFFLAIAAFLLLQLYLVFQDFGTTKLFTLYWVFLFLLADSFIEFHNAFFRSAQLMQYEGIIRVGANVGQASLGILLVYLVGKLPTIVFGTFGVYFTFALLAFLLVKRKFRVGRIVVRRDLMVSLLRKVFPFALIQIFVMIYEKVDIIMLSHMVGDIYAGYYNSAQRLCGVLSFVPASLAAALLPFLSSRGNHGEDLRSLNSDQYLFVTRNLALLILPVVMLFFFLPERVIVLVYGNEYSTAYFSLRVLSIKLALSFINYINVTFLMSLNKEKATSRIVFLGALVNIFLNYLLIPRFFQDGAAAATLAT
ncbi:flippase, partial [Candidatus Parcubacteria bacterium]